MDPSGKNTAWKKQTTQSILQSRIRFIFVQAYKKLLLACTCSCWCVYWLLTAPNECLLQWSREDIWHHFWDCGQWLPTVVQHSDELHYQPHRCAASAAASVVRELWDRESVCVLQRESFFGFVCFAVCWSTTSRPLPDPSNSPTASWGCSCRQ